MAKFLKRMETTVRRFIRQQLAPAETVEYSAFGAESGTSASGSEQRMVALVNVNEALSADGLPRPKSAGPIYVQIGAGAGDQDSRAQFRDGFSEHVKSLPRESVGRVLLVEPNPINIPALKRCWADYPEAEIYQYGVAPKRFSGAKLNFYYLPSDAPHYQVASVNPAHVLKHYRDAKLADLQVLPVDTVDLELFLRLAVGSAPVELLGLDIEGVEADVLMETDLGRLNVKAISVEHLHLGAKARQVHRRFVEAGFVRAGNGIDHNNYDWLYRKRAAGAG